MRRRSAGLRLLGAEGRRRFRARDGRASSCFRRTTAAIPNSAREMVVFHRQPRDAEGPALRFRADVLRLRRARAATSRQQRRIGLARRPGLDGALRDHRHSRANALSRANASRAKLWDWRAPPLSRCESGSRTGASPVRHASTSCALRLAARDDLIGLKLRLASTVPHVAQGDRGLDVKGAGNGNASHYYRCHGSPPTVKSPSRARPSPSTGTAWLDREWSTRLASTPERWAGTGSRYGCRTAAT